MNPLNREAGHVPIPSDPREIDAALLASRVAFRAVPYYPFRYGERGRRFTDSDGGFLLWLEHVDPAHRAQQALWLASVLASRGVPSCLLAQHVRLLFRAARLRTRRSFWGLLAIEQLLAERRRGAIDDDRADALARSFAPATRGVPRRVLRGTGEIVVSAVVDEALGVARAVDTLCAWLANDEHFPPEWCRAVAKLVAEARAAVQAGAHAPSASPPRG